MRETYVGHIKLFRRNSLVEHLSVQVFNAEDKEMGVIERAPGVILQLFRENGYHGMLHVSFTAECDRGQFKNVRGVKLVK